jgi:hypothetical protein
MGKIVGAGDGAGAGFAAGAAQKWTGSATLITALFALRLR